MDSPKRALAVGAALLLAVTLIQPLLGRAGVPETSPLPATSPPSTPDPCPSGPVLGEFRFREERLTGGELAQLLALSGFEGRAHRVAWLVVMRESRGNPRAHNDNASTGDNSYGLFQINMRGYLGKARRHEYVLDWNGDLWDPVTNAWVAYEMSNRGRDWGAWGLGPTAYRPHGWSSLDEFRSQYPGEPKTWPKPDPRPGCER